jgi:hypothetical protein
VRLFVERLFHRGFAEGFNALGAHNLFDEAAILKDGNFLKIGFEIPIGGA